MQELQDIYRLQAFVTVVDEGSLSAAVSKLHITQPALSARLKLLEESVGCQLLERTGRGVRPTPIGKLVYGIAIDILKRMGQLHLTVKNHMELREGWVHLGGGETSVFGIFPDAIQEFRETYPNVQFTLNEQDSRTIVEEVRAGSVDIGIVTRNEMIPREEDPDLDGMHVHLEMTDVLHVVASPHSSLSAMLHSLQKVGKCLLPIHLNKQPMILFEKGSAIRNVIDNELRRLYIHPRVVMTLRSTQSMIRMVEKNIGISIVSSLSLYPGVNVVKLRVEALEMRRRLLIVSAADRTLPPAAERFLTTLKKVCEQKMTAQSNFEEKSRH